MRFAILSLVTILLLMVWHLEARKKNKGCYTAKTCIHNGDEKCGVDTDGKVRRFYDSCDLLEFNCLYNTAFVKTIMKRCKRLPPLDSEITKAKSTTI